MEFNSGFKGLRAWKWKRNGHEEANKILRGVLGEGNSDTNWQNHSRCKCKIDET